MLISCFSKGGDDVFEVFFDADLIIAAGSDFLREKAYRAKKIIRRLDYGHFVQFGKKIEDMTLEEFDNLKKKYGYLGCWERI